MLTFISYLFHPHDGGIFCADFYFGICSTPMMEGGGEWGSGKRAKLHLPVHTAAEL